MLDRTVGEDDWQLTVHKIEVPAERPHELEMDKAYFFILSGLQEQILLLLGHTRSRNMVAYSPLKPNWTGYWIYQEPWGLIDRPLNDAYLHDCRI